MTTDDQLSLASARLDDIRKHVAIVAADADEQNAWLHPCGWTRSEPYEHASTHPPCMPMGEMYDLFDDMWPVWKQVLGPVLTSEIEEALDLLARGLGTYFAIPYVDEIESLDSAEWGTVRQLARTVLPRIAIQGS